MHDLKNTLYSAIGSTILGIVLATVGFTFSEVVIATGVAFALSLISVWALNVLEVVITNGAIAAAFAASIAIGMAQYYSWYGHPVY